MIDKLLERFTLLMVPAVWILAAVVLSGCAGYQTVEVAVGRNVSTHAPWNMSGRHKGGFDGPSEVAELAIRRTSNSGWRWCEWRHTSHLSAGFPVNHDQEDWLDRFQCGATFGGPQGFPFRRILGGGE